MTIRIECDGCGVADDIENDTEIQRVDLQIGADPLTGDGSSNNSWYWHLCKGCLEKFETMHFPGKWK